MKFTNWLEVGDWQEPKEPLQYNVTGVNDFVSAMADPAKNAKAISFIVQNDTPFTDVRYPAKPINGNLLNIQSDKLQNALGEVNTNITKAGFQFFIQPPKAGNLEIVHPPIVYDELDKQLLHGKLLHELQHAQDWADPRFRSKMRPTRFTGKREFDISLYANSLKECRAWGRELTYLMRQVGAEQVVVALTRKPKFDVVMGYTKEPVFNIDQDLIPFAVEFLKNFGNKPSLIVPVKKEDYFPHVPTAAIVDRHEERASRRAASLTAMILKKLFFRNFVSRT